MSIASAYALPWIVVALAISSQQDIRAEAAILEGKDVFEPKERTTTTTTAGTFVEASWRPATTSIFHKEVAAERLVHGKPLAVNVAPYFAHMLSWTDESQSALTYHPACGAALIAPQWVLTASHCVVMEGPADRQIRKNVYGYQIGFLCQTSATAMGESNCGQSTHVVRAVEFHVPPQFRNDQFVLHDVALVRVSRPIWDIPYAVPDTGYVWSRTQRTSSLTVLGRGSTENGEAVSKILESLDMNVMSLRQCESDWNLPYEWNDNLFCMDIYSQSPQYLTLACHGDSGGPVISPDFRYQDDENNENSLNRDVVVGVISGGDVIEGCMTARLPSIFGRVSAFYPRIERLICNDNARPTWCPNYQPYKVSTANPHKVCPYEEKTNEFILNKTNRRKAKRTCKWLRNKNQKRVHRYCCATETSTAWKVCTRTCCDIVC